MAKTIKTTTLLADSEGKVWVEAQLSEAEVKRLIKGYKRENIWLTAYGSPNQLMAQLRELEGAF
jgi:hypothetical protein